MRSDPRDRRTGRTHLACREREAGPPESEMPVAKQALPDEPRHLDIVPVEQRRGSHDPGGDLALRVRGRDGFLGGALSPGIWT